MTCFWAKIADKERNWQGRTLRWKSIRRNKVGNRVFDTDDLRWHFEREMMLECQREGLARAEAVRRYKGPQADRADENTNQRQALTAEVSEIGDGYNAGRGLWRSNGIASAGRLAFRIA